MNHQVELLNNNLADHTDLTFQIRVTEPHDERDVNRVEIEFSIDGQSIETIVIDENARINCGTDDDTVAPVIANSGQLHGTSLTIIPEDWVYSNSNPDISYEILYQLSGLNLSAYVGDTITMTVRAFDMNENRQQASTTFTLN